VSIVFTKNIIFLALILSLIMEPAENILLQKLERFMGGLPIKKLPELFDSVVDGIAVVPVWFDSVVEGVDMWLKGEQVDSNPRYFHSVLCCVY
jgi:hypothetical protein